MPLLETILPWAEEDYEDALELFFYLAKRWNGIVMVEQADTILQGQVDYAFGATWDTGHQSKHYQVLYPQNLTMNLMNLAALFRRAIIRLLDNFNGIVFLIADRKPFGNLDPVDASAKEVLSRINASFEYPALDSAGLVQIFRLNITWIHNVFSKQHQNSSRPARLVIDQDVLMFASAYRKLPQPIDQWNCRQIRKAFSTALALAEADAEPRPQGQQESDCQEPWTVHLNATHFEAVARSTYNMPMARPPSPPRPHVRQYTGDLPRQVPRLPTGPGQRPPPPRPVQQIPTVRKDQASQNTSILPRRQMFPSQYSKQYSKELEVSAIVPIVRVDDGPQRRAFHQQFLLASPLSLEARPELYFMEWESFKATRSQKGSGCSAVDVLEGEPVVSFDQEAQDNVWWSRWGDRNRLISSKAKEEDKPASGQKEKPTFGTGSSPLPERIRINSKYIAAILEEFAGSEMGKTSFVMVRPYRALAYFEAKIRAKYKEPVTRFESSHESTGSQEQALQSQDAEQADASGETPQTEIPGAVNDQAVMTVESPSDDTSSSYDSSGSHPGEVIDTSSPASLEHLKCLVDFLDLIQARVPFLSSRTCTKVTFADIWFLYSPGQEVIDQTRRQVWRILSVNSSGHRTLPPWKAWEDDDLHNAKMQEPNVALDCVHIMFDGKMLGSRTKTFNITRFEGEEEITSLPVLPLHMVQDPDSDAADSEKGLRQKFIERGKMFVDLIRSKPMHYNGPLIHPKEEVDSQVVVDFEQCFAYWSRNAEFKRPMVEQLIGKPIGQSVPILPCEASCCAGEQVHDDAYAEQKRNEAYIGSLIPDPQDRTQKPSIAISPRPVPKVAFKDHELSDEDLVIMSYTVCGFILRSRTWGEWKSNHRSMHHNMFFTISYRPSRLNKPDFAHADA